MSRKQLLWLAVDSRVAVVVAFQVTSTIAAIVAVRRAGRHPHRRARCRRAGRGGRGAERIRGYDYRRAAFGERWTDDNDAPGGHNGCDTRNDILDRDLVDKTYVSIKRCPTAVATGTLLDPYTNAVVPFMRGDQVGAAVQIDHIVPFAYAWDLGRAELDRRDADPVRQRPRQPAGGEGQANQDKGDEEPAVWMPPNPRSGASTRCSSSRCCAAMAAGRCAVGGRPAGGRRDLSEELSLRHLRLDFLDHPLCVVKVGVDILHRGNGYSGHRHAKFGELAELVDDFLCAHAGAAGAGLSTTTCPSPTCERSRRHTSPRTGARRRSVATG